MCGYLREFDDGLLTPEDIETLATYHDIKNPHIFGTEKDIALDKHLGILAGQIRSDAKKLKQVKQSGRDKFQRFRPARKFSK